jgi:hypothetical protein
VITRYYIRLAIHLVLSYMRTCTCLEQGPSWGPQTNPLECEFRQNLQLSSLSGANMLQLGKLRLTLSGDQGKPGYPSPFPPFRRETSPTQTHRLFEKAVVFFLGVTIDTAVNTSTAQQTVDQWCCRTFGQLPIWLVYLLGCVGLRRVVVHFQCSDDEIACLLHSPHGTPRRTQ